MHNQPGLIHFDQVNGTKQTTRIQIAVLTSCKCVRSQEQSEA